MESSSSSDYQERRVGPTVSKDKWVNHAKAKLSKGYALIIGKNKRTANFYLRSKGFEMCPYNVAKQLVKDGLVVEAGEHPLGTMYRLADNVAPVEVKRKPATVVKLQEQPEVIEDVEDDVDSDVDEAEEAVDDEGEGDEDEVDDQF
jgi:hypothetical protein